MSGEKTKNDIRSLNVNMLNQAIEDLGEKPFRARQIYHWIWGKSVTSFNQMSSLSKAFRDTLRSEFEIWPISIDTLQKSEDNTIKVAFKLFDDHFIEGVLIPAEKRMTACISSQVGCSLSCKFCATGYLERQRNLSPGEIYDQVVLIKNLAEEHYQKPLTNIVFMGMGEPMLNFGNVMLAIEHLTSPDGLQISPRRITVSTAGIAKMIKKCGDDKSRFKLALSLHAANDLKRSQIMPINESNTLASLSEALQYFNNKTKSLITLEYIVLKDFNDSLEDARELVAFSRKFPCKVNIIEYNPIDQASFQNADEDRLELFRDFLEKNRVPATLRQSRGKDIDAACGQLANKHL
jgi:23S rRNA (adenine2503-C2)-methyltransferase